MLARSAAQYVRRGVARGPAMRLPHAQQTRSFLLGRALSSYWMKRAKIAHIVGRMVVAYPEMHYIPDPDAPINQLFARDATERERAFMFVLSQVPPDEPIDLHEFVRGASDAAVTVVESIYNDAQKTEEALASLATPQCLTVWKQKRKQVCELLDVKEAAALRLEKVKVRHAGVSEVNYTYSDAKQQSGDAEAAKDSKEQLATVELNEQKTKQQQPVEPMRLPSKFMMFESIQLKVKFNVREQLSVNGAESEATMLDTAFEWTFESDVSRADAVDWVVTATSPFETKIAPNDDDVESIAKDIEEAA